MDLVHSAINRVARAHDVNSQSTAKPPRVGMVVDMSDAHYLGGFIPALSDKADYPYSRPEFLYYSDEEISLSSDQTVRPVVCPKYAHRMILHAGYAEVVNAGKSTKNEDQATARMLTLFQQGSEAEEATVLETDKKSSRNGSSNSDEELLASPGETSTQSSSICGCRAEAAFFAILDGHAGPAAAIVASKCLHEHIKSRLSAVLETIIHLDRQESLVYGRRQSSSSYSSKNGSDEEFTCDKLVIGALEAAFVDMDEQIAEEKKVWRLPGGCAALCALVFMGKIYIANAGDCRSVLVSSDGCRPLSNDFNPATERKRIQSLAYHNPELIGNFYSRLEYSRHLTKIDLNTKVLYRDWFMDGWAAKTVKESDLRPTLISDTFKKKRLLNTIGVSRGFGDHLLMTVDERLHIKPFLSPVPEVQVLDIRKLESVTDKDVIILASDGLWDVLSNEDAGMIVRSTLSTTDPSDLSRYSMAAQELVVAARGVSDGSRWTMSSGSYASTDDITVFVIPLSRCAGPPQTTEEDEDDELLSLNE